ncbi:MAG: tetratricopeptide repeat protein, partial [Alphaproteobacteria bacterium]|nr:tetratricopeptide repeat protein [Alphaproteobacteria bacterium]
MCIRDRDYTEAIGLDPGLADAYDNRGNAHHEKGEFDLALADYREAMDLGSDNAVESHNRTLAVARQSAQKTIDEYKKRYGDQLKEALAAREKQLQDEFAERGKQFEEMLSRLENPQAIVAKFERREVLYTVSVWGLNVFIIIFALAVATVLPVVAWLVLRELTDLAYQPSPVPEWAVLPLLSLVLGLISYPLFSQLRHLRDVRNRLEVCREDYFRKGIIAEYIIRAGISDGDRRQEAIAKFQSHLAEKSAAEFLSNHEKPAKKGGGRTFLGDVYNLASPDAGDDISRF